MTEKEEKEKELFIPALSEFKIGKVRDKVSIIVECNCGQKIDLSPLLSKLKEENIIDVNQEIFDGDEV